ncbi:cytochrome P460 [Pedobacter lusitanus]|uniref:Cytochrome P460 n=1 Tax=Pedobacter lusitanus TaxID=1503925 RepID=A0A0D0GL47_9SPHI|nr:heme-binding domain-containing protein [Pedobacter lusitanus]KIO76885.1 cytochrome P460 [Pedobacter lusitanus]
MKKPFYKRKTLRVLGILAGCFFVLQLFRPELKKEAVTADFNGPENVKTILKKACYDCHSNETDLKWFDQFQPAYSIAVSDVKEGKAGLNFSEWGNMAAGEQKAKLFEILNQMTTGAMPLKSYQLLHRSAILSPDEIAVVKNYVAGMIKEHPADTALLNAADKQFKTWQGESKPAKLPETLTGIPFQPDYKNWQVVSTTDRTDNGTMRVIFGNPVAMKAIAEHRINPWPDGAIFAKVAWDKLQDADGNVKSGAFKQVEYMIKDSKKYKSTKGWGWARFKTMQLLPYGKNIGYATECVNCHRPVSNNDFVFTLPVKH